MKKTFKILIVVLCLTAAHNHQATAAWLKIKNMSNSPVRITNVILKTVGGAAWGPKQDVEVYDKDYYITVPPGETKIVDPGKYRDKWWGEISLFIQSDEYHGKARCGEYVNSSGQLRYFLTVHAFDHPTENRAAFIYYNY